MLRDRVELGFEHWGRFVFRHRWWVLLGSLLFASGWTAWIPHITFDNSTESFLLKRDPASKLYREFRNQFGQDDHILIAIAPPEVFELDFLERLRAFHRALEAGLPHIEDITSILNARQTRGEEDALIVEELACVRSRMALIVGLVVPTSLQICASLISGFCLRMNEIASGLSPRLETGV